ncbi:MAG: CDP-glucose 4,6-dehydratase [Eubacteriales bacterium]|nr:CDP-glucose 4,6-dehydratase [Eubacteriales bacterium]
MKFDIERLNDFYKGKKVLLTGHTGFKGCYLTAILSMLGAKVYGYSLTPPTSPSLFEIMFGEGAGKNSAHGLTSKEEKAIRLEESFIGDIRDFEALKAFYNSTEPDIVLHLAAQPIVRDSYKFPRETYETNVMGTVNLLECVRLNPCCISFLNVTTDKVYKNEEREGYGYREDDKLDGYDPYSNSKSCSELVTHSYSSSFLEARGIPVSTARAGNVIGGGDFANDRIIPDCVRAMLAKEKMLVRNPYSTRPYQHVMEPLFIYLTIAMMQAEDKKYAGWYNVGPDDCDCVTTGELTELFKKYAGKDFEWYTPGKTEGPHEANFLKLSNEKIKEVFDWKPVWHIDRAIEETVNWTKAWMESSDRANYEMARQIEKYMADVKSL